MRKRYRVLLLAFIAAACVVPVGYALSLESESDVMYAPPAVVIPVPLQQQEIPEGGRLVLAGGAFFGLAAVLRRVA